MRQRPVHTQPYALLTGLATLALGLSLTSCTASGPSSQVHVSSPAPTATARPLRQAYVYLSDAGIMVDGVPNAQQTKPGGTLSVQWTARAYNQSADATPITLSLFVYGPFASKTDAYQAMRLGGPPSLGQLAPTPVPLSQLAISPFAAAQPIHTDTWSTTPFTTTLHLPASMPPGYYDIVALSVAGTQNIGRGDAPLQVMPASGQ